MKPYKYSKANIKTGKVYEYTFTEKDMEEMGERLKKGEKMADILKSIRERLTDADWQEV